MYEEELARLDYAGIAARMNEVKAGAAAKKRYTEQDARRLAERWVSLYEALTGEVFDDFSSIPLRLEGLVDESLAKILASN